MAKSVALLLILAGVTANLGQEAPAGLLARRYHDGEKLAYHMKGQNEQWSYQIQASGVVKRDANGRYVEEYAWSNLTSDGAPFKLNDATLKFHQLVSLDPAAPPSIPSLAQVQPILIGPITDFMTFYADLWLAIRTGKLNHAGDHFYQKQGTPASWADGNYTVLGEDSIDFDMTLTEITESNNMATLLVRHVPPEQPQVKLTAAWMREPVGDTPNNWVNVTKRGAKYVAEAGQETFDVEMKVSLADGRILWGSLHNPVKARQRECVDAALTDCGDSKSHDILRHIEISLEP